MLQGKRAAAAHLYFLSNSVMFGEFRLSVHRDNPDLPLSPIYLQYHKRAATPELLPALYGLLGQLLYDLTQQSHIEWDYVAGVPQGAWPLASGLAGQYQFREGRGPRSDFLLRFSKEERPDGGTVFAPPPEVGVIPGDRLLIVEDHTSGGRNKKLIRVAAEAAGLKVTDMLTVVDRQQGGVAAMAHEGVTLHSLFTLDDLLDFGREQGYIDEEMVVRVRTYIADHQLWSLNTDPPQLM